MPRLMSVAFTESAVRSRRKSVTRRLGWRHARVGDELDLCRKVMGRKPGEPLERIVRVRLVDVRREPLTAMLEDPVYGWAETAREGFPTLAPDEFVHRFFVDAQKVPLDTEVARLEWRYIDPVAAIMGPCVCGHWGSDHPTVRGSCRAPFPDGRFRCRCEAWVSTSVES